MAYEIPKIEGESSITWNNKVYWPVTEWTVSSGINNGWLAAAVRFLMEEGATETSFHIVAQYTAWTRTGSIDRNNGYMLIRKLASEITTYTNEGGVQQQGSFFSTKNTNQRQGYVYNGVLTGSKIWYDTPYFMTEAWTTLNGNTSAGTVGDGVTVYSSTFYVGTTEVNAGVYSQTSINASYTTPLRTYEISYNANGGTGTTASQTKVRGTDIVLSANSFTRSNYHFVEWNTAADGTGTSYAEGATYSTDSALTLYAIWAINYVLPTYNNIQLYRVDQDGVMDDYGDYVELSFDYVFGGNKFSTGTVHVQYRQVGSTNWTDLTTWTQSGTITTTSGSWNAYTYVSSSSKVSFSTDVAWEFQLWLTDNTTDGETYNSTIYNTVLTIALFPLDIYGGTSLAVGTPAPEILPTDTDDNPTVGGIFTLGKSWDMNMPLDSTNAIDDGLNTAITDAGISADVFHDTGGLSLKLLLTSLLVNSGVEIISNNVTHQFNQSSYTYTCFKFSSGLLIALFSTQCAAGTGSNYNGEYYRVYENIKLPSAQDASAPAFISQPWIIAQPRASTNLLGVHITWFTTTTLNIWLHGPNASIPTTSIDFVCVGQWK